MEGGARAPNCMIPIPRMPFRLGSPRMLSAYPHADADANMKLLKGLGFGVKAEGLGI